MTLARKGAQCLAARVSPVDRTKWSHNNIYEIALFTLQQLSMEGSDGNLSAADYSSGTDNSIVSSPEPPVESVQLESRLAVERDLLENDTTLLSAERHKLLQDLAAKEEKLKREKAEQEAMLSKIKALESKLISGTGKGLFINVTSFL